MKRMSARPRRTMIGLIAFALLLPTAGFVGARAVTVECAQPGAPGGEWPQFGGDLKGSRNQTKETQIDSSHAINLSPVWTFNANRGSVSDGTFGKNSEITGSPIVADGCVFVGTSTGNQTPGWIFALNADTGEIVWRTRVSHGVYATVAVDSGRVFAFVSRVGGSFEGDQSGPDPWGPYVVALDEQTGEVLWQKTVDAQVGADAVSSPIVFDGMVWVGVSGTAAEGDEADRGGFQGNFVLLDAATGARLAKTYSIPESEWEAGYAGGAVWSTISVDPDTKYGYVGTGNPFNYHEEHLNTNAVIKIDLDRSRGTFGAIVGTYKGQVEKYFPPVQDAIEPNCEDVEDLTIFAGGFECGNLDLDFGAQPNLFTDSSGLKIVGIGQKSGVYHAIDADTMLPVWTQLLGVPSAVGGIVGSAAVDDDAIYGPHTLGGYLWSVTRDEGTPRWITPVGDGIHWGNPGTVANHVLYTVDLKGFLDAYDTQTGLPILHRPIVVGSDTWTDPTFTWGGVTVARETVFVTVGVGLTSVGVSPYPKMPNGFVVAFRPQLPEVPLA